MAIAATLTRSRCRPQASQYTTGSTWMLALRVPRSRLNKHEKELLYLMQKLEKVEELTLVPSNFRDFLASWEALLQLLPALSVPRGEAVLELIGADEKVLLALSAADALRDIKGDPPPDLIALLNMGPGKHIRDNAYGYRRVLDMELSKIVRIKAAQLTVISYIAAGFFGLLTAVQTMTSILVSS